MKSCQFSVFSFQLPEALDCPLPTAHCPPQTAHRRGMSLLEVLAAIGVLSVGLLGLAALLPLGRYTIAEATKADRTGDCGRAAMRDVIVRRILDAYPVNPLSPPSTYAQWLVPNTDTDAVPSIVGRSFVIDPEGASSGLTGLFAGIVPRVTLGVSPLVRQTNRFYQRIDADAVFQATDDLIVTLPEEMKPSRPVGRPMNLDASGQSQRLNYAGEYSWFLTVVPDLSIPTRFTVSVVVCFKRDLAATAERAVAVSAFTDQVKVNGVPVAIGGGGVQLAREINDIASDKPPAGISIKENDWVALYSAYNGTCRWYRVASVGDNSSYLTLVGSDWVPNSGDQLIALGQSVLGVYTTTVDLDTDPTWMN